MSKQKYLLEHKRGYIYMNLNHITPYIFSILFFLNWSNNVLANEIDKNNGRFYYSYNGDKLYYHNENKNFSIYMDRDYSDNQNLYNIKYVDKRNILKYYYRSDSTLKLKLVQSVNKLDDICNFSIVSMVIRSRDENSKYLYTIVIFGADKEFFDILKNISKSNDFIEFNSFEFLKKNNYNCNMNYKIR